MNSNPQKMPKVAKVKNKAPAEIQITAEQLLREAKERDLEIQPPPPKQKISDPAELADYQHRRRKQFEDNIRKNRTVMTNWIKYAQWEESQKEIQRARSIYERGLDIDHRNIIIWLKYTEMEMRCKQVNHARNLWDRAVTILPRVNQFWYKYTYMEEMLENIPGTRAVFERWMEWQPDEQAWQTYINFELRFKEIDRAREIYERFVVTHPIVRHWIKFARFEENHGFIHSARAIYERAVHFYGDEYMEEKLYIAFARFEENQKEHDRARVIYKYALDHIPKEQTKELYKAYTIHEKKYGDRSGIEDVIVSKRKFQYEQEIVQNPTNYDAWFDLLRLVEGEGDSDSIRETYERAIANIPPVKNKQFWRRYIYLWINYALYEELEARDFDRARLVYKECLQLLPHKVFTFSKIWLLLAQFEIRRKNLTAARKTLGYAIGTCPRDKLFRGYIEMEIQLREFDRCRVLYQKFLEFGPENCITWMKFAELETLLGDYTRARCIYELAIGQTRLDMPELLWKAYIDFEIGQDEPDNARNLYERLLERTTHVKVWLSYAKFELNADGSAESTENAVAKENEGKTSGDISNTGEITIQNNIPEKDTDSSENTTEDENSSSAVDKRQVTTETSNESTNKSTSTEVATSNETISTEVATSNENTPTEVATSSEPTSSEVASSNETISTKIATSNETISTEVATSNETTSTKVAISNEITSSELSSTSNPDNDMNIRLSRRVYERANDHLKTAGVDKESRVLLLEQWREFEERWGDESTRGKVAGKMPRRIKKRQSVVDESGVDQGWEEVFDYIFPEDEAGRPNLKLLAAAKNWKKKSDVVEELGSSSGPAE